jgi:hypothetical protein
LTTTVSSDIFTGNTGSIQIKIMNSGDEAAYDVQISLLTDVFESEPIHVEKLNPNEQIEKNFEISLTRTIPAGKYPVPVVVDYADANSYPFSSVSPAYVIYKTKTTSTISGLIPEVTLIGKESKKLTLSIRNLDDKNHDVDVKLILPREIKVNDEKNTISIGSKQERSLYFEVFSLSAISGSTYAILASMEYDDDNLHYTSFANGIIKIDGGTTSKTKGPEQTSSLAYIILIISMVFVLIYAYPKYFKRGKRVEEKKVR